MRPVWSVSRNSSLAEAPSGHLVVKGRGTSGRWPGSRGSPSGRRRGGRRQIFRRGRLIVGLRIVPVGADVVRREGAVVVGVGLATGQIRTGFASCPTLRPGLCCQVAGQQLEAGRVVICRGFGKETWFCFHVRSCTGGNCTPGSCGRPIPGLRPRAPGRSAAGDHRRRGRGPGRATGARGSGPGPRRSTRRTARRPSRPMAYFTPALAMQVAFIARIDEDRAGERIAANGTRASMRSATRSFSSVGRELTRRRPRPSPRGLSGGRPPRRRGART